MFLAPYRCFASVVTLSIAYVSGMSCVARPQSPCFAEMPVYDAAGNRVPFNIVEVTLEEDKTVNFLASKYREYGVEVRGSTLYFSKALIGRKPIEVTLENPQGRRLKRRLVLLGCELRTSVQYGQLDSGADVGWSTIIGRISGCNLTGDWWVRATPMFGGLDDIGRSFEGYVRSSDGTFSLHSSIRGERYIIAIGKDKQPVKAVGTNVIVGGRNDVGVVDLKGLCPEP
jgi:hypothetical protein